MTHAESKYWVTAENVDQLITAEFFHHPCTTGVCDETSAHWRYYCRTGDVWQLLHKKDGQVEPPKTVRTEKKKEKDEPKKPKHRTDKVVSEEGYEDVDLDLDLQEHIPRYTPSLREKMEARAQEKTDKVLGLRSMIDSMIGSGEEREKYAELLEDFTLHMEKSQGPNGSTLPGKFADPENMAPIDELTREDLMEFFADPHVCGKKKSHIKMLSLTGQMESMPYFIIVMIIIFKMSSI
jgi:hypothetical protein